MNVINPIELNQRMKAGQPGLMLDVRTPAEYAALHVPGAALEPLDSFKATRVAERYAGAKTPLYIICRSGTRAKEAIGRLEKAGHTECHLVEGGIEEWERAGLPVERGPSRVISLERQVRIAAGAVVLIGTLLGVYWIRGFLAVPGAVGAGLIFAGVTDRCGLAVVLGKMPWNRAGVEMRGCCLAPKA
jgi:rhodanese-related sulfurtransferase